MVELFKKEKGKKLPQGMVDRIVRQFDQGLHIGEIAKKNDIHRDTVKKYIHQES